jgi:hypothetical protein
MQPDRPPGVITPGGPSGANFHVEWSRFVVSTSSGRKVYPKIGLPQLLRSTLANGLMQDAA